MCLETDIYLVGLGLYDLRQLTCETETVLRGVNAVYHFSAKHVELCRYNENTHDVRSFYADPWGVADVYEKIAETFVELAQQRGPIAVAFDGSPMLYCTVAWRVAEVGGRAGLRVEALAGVSCLDVLPTQLGFDPGDFGMQTLETTLMVKYELALNPYLSTLLLQISHFGVHPGLAIPEREEGAFRPVIDHLLRYFPPDHPAVLIESATGASVETILLTTEIERLDGARHAMRSGMTLYLPRTEMPALMRSQR